MFLAESLDHLSDSGRRITYEIATLAKGIPLYRFALQGDDPPLDEDPEWLESDVEALKVAAKVAADCTRNRVGRACFVVAIRVTTYHRRR
jgi:hypothetical protein